MKAKKLKQHARNHWKVEIKTFVQALGELELKRPHFPRIPLLRRWEYEPSKASLRLRLAYMWAILRSPGLTRKGKLLDYLREKWPGKTDGLHEQGWVRYEKVLGPVIFKCRTRRELPGTHVQVLVRSTYWDENKAFKLMSPDLHKMYNEADINGQHLMEVVQEYKAEVDKQAAAKEAKKKALKDAPIPVAKSTESGKTYAPDGSRYSEEPIPITDGERPI